MNPSAEIANARGRIPVSGLRHARCEYLWMSVDNFMNVCRD